LRAHGAAAELRWTTNSAGFALESAPTLPSAEWSPVRDAVNVIAGDYSVTVETGAAQRIYRLRKP
jgi:hypothetical protein